MWHLDSATAAGSALPDRGIQVSKVLMLHRIISSHPSLWIAYQQALYYSKNTTFYAAQ